MIYVLAFEQPLGNPRNKRGQASYYVGYCADNRLQTRLMEHRNGWGANITRAAAERGINFDVIAVAPGYREEETRLKKMKDMPRRIERLRQGKSDPLGLRLV